MKAHPGVRITTGETGSGAGIDQAISGAVHIGTSDAYMTDAQAKKYPQIINVPMAISAMTVNYNLPGLDNVNLKLDGPALVGIYTGKIRAWDDKPIAALNPGVALPHKDIIPIHRATGPATPSCSPSTSPSRLRPGRTPSATPRRSTGRPCRVP
jgi:phosphate transport system substrate-binding protein